MPTIDHYQAHASHRRHDLLEHAQTYQIGRQRARSRRQGIDPPRRAALRKRVTPGPPQMWPRRRWQHDDVDDGTPTAHP